jgi:hypothetical protein
LAFNVRERAMPSTEETTDKQLTFLISAILAAGCVASKKDGCSPKQAWEIYREVRKEMDPKGPFAPV